ncbi:MULTISPECIES: UMP kinase [unclassified Commensalibacter]|uniref:UMP kinase n=1 Tax=unclassified Commensalibacter TaxID=2630218 RepID=UPI0018DD39DE|nr:MULTISPECIES: UMP kinase [unclassified Commensalibacter]MBI0016503.1 UMP kinase [Commensalibacter sp. B14384M2]MBI0018250.1 UMP kinase [Commensalibacter sp. W8133]MBI0049688.1 UMP kinase [Commensalibacter sp. B14384M3]MBI0179735.1 UMP kinase [Commensalibacter sp. W8163]
MVSSEKIVPKRVLLKISGEALLGEGSYGIDPKIANAIVSDIANVVKSGVEVCLVIGGGNIFRGMTAASKGIDRVHGDYAGMLATVINAIVLHNVLEQHHIESCIMSAIDIPQIAENYVRNKAISHIKQGRVVIFAAGTGNPYFTTDTAAALRAIEMGCDIMLKGTQVDGVYDSDPKNNPDAKRYDTITYSEALIKELNIMDATAFSLAQDNKLPMIVFNVHKEGNFENVLLGNGVCTRVVASSSNHK